MVDNRILSLTINALGKNKGRHSMTNGAAWNHHYCSRFRRSRKEKLAGREGFEPSIPDPKSGALPLGDRPSPNLSMRSSTTPGKIRLILFESRFAPCFGHDLMVFR